MMTHAQILKEPPITIVESDVLLDEVTKVKQAHATWMRQVMDALVFGDDLENFSPSAERELEVVFDSWQTRSREIGLDINRTIEDAKSFYGLVIDQAEKLIRQMKETGKPDRYEYRLLFGLYEEGGISERFISHLDRIAERVNYMRSSIDFLSGLPNRMCLSDMIRHGEEAGTILFVDIDKFKRINDEHGHEEGDKVIKRVARIIETSVRDEEKIGGIVYRLGGEEYAVNLKVPLEIGKLVAERIRARVEEEYRTTLGTTVSVGIAERLGNESFDETMKRADLAMLTAKKTGRNRVMIGQNDTFVLSDVPQGRKEAHGPRRA